jgi:copper chaperone
MQVFRIDDMTCGHCASTITKAVRAIDAGARVEVDMDQRLVRVEANQANATALRDAIIEAGYTPVAVEPTTTAQQPGRKAGCCGCCG